MRAPRRSFVLLILLCSCGGGKTASQPQPEAVRPPSAVSTPKSLHSTDPVTTETDAIARAVADAARPEEDRARDADRKPAEVLAFFAAKPGMMVADLMTGRGYYAELLSRVVGPTGKVYAQNSPFVVKRFADKPLRERLARPGLENVIRIDTELTELGIHAESLDLVLLVNFYHDTYWQGVDRKAMNRAVLVALKPGGMYGVIDHHAAPGTRDRDVKTLHRVDADIVKQEVLAAGFEWVAESKLLSHAEDDRTKSVFDDALRGKTDRFIYKFRKPVPKN